MLKLNQDKLTQCSHLLLLITRTINHSTRMQLTCLLFKKLLLFPLIEFPVFLSPLFWYTASLSIPYG